MEKLILVCNDDGIDARGIEVLEMALLELGQVVVVAPDSEQSASSHSLTLRKPISVNKLDDRHYRVGGTPTDCIVLANQVILDRTPDLLVSGINHGPNMGEDVTYSGTVAAAFEGHILGLPSIAISSLQRAMENTEEIGRVARMVVAGVLNTGLSKRTLLNVNIPDPDLAPIKGMRITKLGSRAYENFVEPTTPVGGESFYTIGGIQPVWQDDEGTDIAAVRSGYVSITPLHLDLTHYKAVVDMERWRFEL